MSLKRRIAATVASLMLVAGGLSFSTVTSLAFSCGGGYVNGQKDGWFQTGSYYEHHWLGYCWGNNSYYYAGNDSRYSWGGSWHSISSITAELRAWDCWGNNAYNSSVTLYNTAYNQLVSQTMCGAFNGPDSDSNDEAYQAGVFDWWNYLQWNGGTSPASPVGIASTTRIAGLSITEGASSGQPATISVEQARTVAKAKVLAFAPRLRGVAATSAYHSSTLFRVTDGHVTENFSQAINAWVIQFDAPSQNHWATVAALVVVNAQTGVIESASLAESN